MTEKEKYGILIAEVIFISGKKKEPNVIGIQAKIISIGEINALNIDAFTSAYLKTNTKFTKAITKKLDTVAIGAP